MKILLASPRGFCAGVERAITIVEQSIAKYGSPIYVRHEVVHNRYVVEKLREKGAIFVNQLNEVPEGETVIFSAHGVSEVVHREGASRKLKVLDATCPLVTKVHNEVKRFRKDGYKVILIGHAGHPEVEGTLGQVKHGVFLVEEIKDIGSLPLSPDEKIACVTQTTLSLDDTRLIMDELKISFPTIIFPRKDDICYATQNRQDAVKELAKNCDVLLVVGSMMSSNSNRLKEIAERLGVRSYLIDEATDITMHMLEGCEAVGVTAGASAPEILVQQVVERLKSFGGALQKENARVVENVTFSLPSQLKVV